jgi:regulatory protein
VPEHSPPEEGGVRVVRLDGIGIDEGGPAPVARLDLPDPAEPARPAADLTDLHGSDAAPAPVAFFATDNGSADADAVVDGATVDGAVVDGPRKPGAAPVAHFDAEQLTSTGRQVPVAELGPAARGRPAGRRARSASGDGGRRDERSRDGDGARRADRADRGNRAAGAGRVDRADHGDRADRVGRGNRAAQVDRGNQAGRVDGADQVEPDDQVGRSTRAGRMDRADRTGSSASDAGTHAARVAGRADRRSGPAPDADPVSMAREICLRLLTDRARTRQELAQALRRKGIPDDVAGSVLERFDEVGLIDDAAFAGQWVRSRHAHRGLARRAIAVELRRKGVADEVAGEALAEVDGESEERRARELVDRKLRSLKVASAEQQAVASRRLVGMLARKGYGAGVAYRVVREALAEHGADVEELDGAEPPDE